MLSLTIKNPMRLFLLGLYHKYSNIFLTMRLRAIFFFAHFHGSFFIRVNMTKRCPGFPPHFHT